MINFKINNTDKPLDAPVPVKYFTFSAGEVQVDVNAIRIYNAVLTNNARKIPTHVTIDAFVNNSEVVMALAMTVDAIRRVDASITIGLKLKYLPYSRQDRVMNPGEALSLKVFCNMINSLNFTEVEVWDVHSDVSLALLDRVKHIPVEQLARYVPVPNGMNNLVLVAPDAGAIKKIDKVAKAMSRPFVRADKVRSVKDGSITGTTVYSDHIGTQDFLIVDDICDGGRTFIELAKILRPLTNGNVYLYVTHGIFSNGLDVFNGVIDRIYVSNPFPSVDITNPIIYMLRNTELTNA